MVIYVTQCTASTDWIAHEHPLLLSGKKDRGFTARLINYAHELCHLEQQMVKLREGGDPAYIFVSNLPKPSGYSGLNRDDLGWVGRMKH